MKPISVELSANFKLNKRLSEMKQILLLLTSIFIIECVNAQIPYFSSTVGNNKLYGYTSIKLRPGINAQETYTTFQYGIGNSLATGVDLSTSHNAAYAGILIRYGHKFSPYLGLGGQMTPSFDLNDNMKFKYLTTAIYTNGNILRDGRLFWASNI